MSNGKALGYVVVGKGKIEKKEFDLPTLGDDDIEVKVDYCGLCHSDLHSKKQVKHIFELNNLFFLENTVFLEEWGKNVYPLILGHEIIGTVTQVGKNVTRLQKGQLVGVGMFTPNISSTTHLLIFKKIGWQKNSCGAVKIQEFQIAFVLNQFF